MTRPTYIYKLIASSSPIPQPLPEDHVFPLSELDATDGFMHFSTAVQVPRTLKRFFATDASITIVRINYNKVEQEIRWENPKGTAPGEVGGDGVFPHIHGRAMKASDVESFVIWERGDDWDAALESGKDCKKRKRPVDDGTSERTSVDLQEFVQKHGYNGDNASTTTTSATLNALVQKSRDRKRQKKEDKLEAKKKTISLPKALKPAEKRKGREQTLSASSSASSIIPPPAKRPKRTHEEPPRVEVEEKPLPTIPEETSSLFATDEPPSVVAARAKLSGARFRLINESLYKSGSKEAHEMMRRDPEMFEEYHRGFRHQVESWPTNPVEHYISVLSKYPARTTIADLGCGDAAMARTLTPKGFNVLSFDLVSDGVFVVEADICSRIPLPGSEPSAGEKSSGDGQVVDVVVCALSLMGTNWIGCLREAWRILRTDGELKIAEVASRFTDVEVFTSVIAAIGFKLKSKDASNTHFTLFEFRKVGSVGKKDKEWADLLKRGGVLKPEYFPGCRVTTTMLSCGSLNSTRIANPDSALHRHIHQAPDWAHADSACGTGHDGCSGAQNRSPPDDPSHMDYSFPYSRSSSVSTSASSIDTCSEAPIYHLGLFREKVTLQPVEYYSKLPSPPSVDMVYLLDPVIATGGTVCAALAMLTDWGMSIKNIKLLSILASQEGIDHVRAEYPELEIWVGGVDATLTSPDGFISPGLGDAGDRLFNTL
uniref:Uracil phosphoribosyltransferase n=1 Tax=Mycena chlorophos TaxID=658473 RepID=A0ABQ0LSJ4_MYCCL|nr:uracil phosphoribosyltransferase [Mycena chlorophos]